MFENDLRDLLFYSHKNSFYKLISGLKPLEDKQEDIYDFSICKLLQKVTERKIHSFVENLCDLTLIGREVRLQQNNRSTTRIDLLGISEASVLNIIELKTSKKSEREAFTELLGYANHYSLLFPGLKDSALNSILVAPMESRITQDAFLQEILINNKPILALKPIHNKADQIELQVYYPDATIYKHFENNIVNDQSMITVVLTFNEIKGWIDTDINNAGTIPKYSKDALNTISTMISQKLEAEGLHSIVYASQQWGEVSKIFPLPNKITVVAINPFSSLRTSTHEGVIYGASNDDRVSAIQSIYNQLTEEGKEDWLSYMENGFHDRLIRIVKDVFEESIGYNQNNLKTEVRYEISIPDWYGLKINMIESVFVHNLNVFCTGLLREIISEYIKLMYLDDSEEMEKFPYKSINNWFLVWTILERIGSEPIYK